MGKDCGVPGCLLKKPHVVGMEAIGTPPSTPHTLVWVSALGGKFGSWSLPTEGWPAEPLFKKGWLRQRRRAA